MLGGGSCLSGKSEKDKAFFDDLCMSYYEKVLRYLCSKLDCEAAARDCTQDVFLVALQKSTLLRQHPNPGGFLFQTAKNIAKKKKRESFQQMMLELDAEDTDIDDGIPDLSDYIQMVQDQQINEEDYIESVLSELSEEKRRLYTLYYLNKESMREIALLFGVEEAAMRMRFVRLRREIRTIAAAVAVKYFIS